MDNLNFGSNNYTSTPSSYSSEEKSFMVEFLIKKGIVKDQKTGNNVLLVFAIVLLGISGYMVKNTLFPSSTPTVEQTETVSE